MRPNQVFHIQKEATAHILSAFSLEAQHRKGRTFEEWHRKEAEAVQRAASEMAEKHGLRAPTLEEVFKVERSAAGHSDYASKWALYAFELTLAPEPEDQAASRPRMNG